MFRKFLVFAMIATAAGFCFADDTSTPIWPTPGSDADLQIPDAVEMIQGDGNSVVSKMGDDVIIENNVAYSSHGKNWSGGSNLLHNQPAPAGFNVYENQAEMPLFHTEMPEDDGAAVLAVSRAPAHRVAAINGGGSMRVITDNDISDEFASIDDSDTDVASAVTETGQVHSWVVASGQTLREVLEDWCDKEGWDLIWGTSREYPVQASAVFKGRFTDVASALVRNFSRATPVPYAKFYKGNKVLVITTSEEGL